MNPSLATLVYCCGIATLFFLNRDSSVRTSPALWLPVAYLWVVGSRPVPVWLGITTVEGTRNQLDGSPLDAAFFGLLSVVAVCVLVSRSRRTISFLNANWLILSYFLFCLVSVLWSEFPGISFKRWIKAVGDLLMILIVVTDEQPLTALSRLFSRVGFILVPISFLLIKYYPHLGKAYDDWTGAQTFTGAALDKNMLGVITLVISLGTFWHFLGLLRSQEKSKSRRRLLLAQGTLLALSIWLLITADSVTSIVSFLMGAGLMVATNLRFMRRHPAAVHALVVLLIVAVTSVMLLGGGASAAEALGRNPTLTGRTDIWAAVLPLAPSPMIGAGFESFWLSTHVHQKLEEALPGLGLRLNEAHDGYIEVYLELGWVGLSLIILLLIDGYRRSVKAFRRDPALGGLLIAYSLVIITYSITEAGFRMLDPIWIFFLLAVVLASSIAAGIAVETPAEVSASSQSSQLIAKPSFLVQAGKPTTNWSMTRRGKAL